MIIPCLTKYLECVSPFNYFDWAGGYPPIDSPVLFPDDLFPVPEGEGVCGISNSGGRDLVFTDSVDVIDQIGDETRTLHTDRCIKNDGVGGVIDLGQTLSLTKWAIGFRNEGHLSSVANGIFAAFNTIRGIEISYTGYLSYRENNGTHHKWDGTGNTIDTPYTPYNGLKNDFFYYSDGVNIYLYVNGENRGYITPTSTIYIFQYLINGDYSGYPDRGINGNTYDARIWDELETLTAQEINDYFEVNACLFHVDNMANPSVDALYSDGSATLTFDSLDNINISSYEGTSTPTINGDTIELSEGYIYNLLLDDGSFFDLSNNTDKTTDVMSPSSTLYPSETIKPI